MVDYLLLAACAGFTIGIALSVLLRLFGRAATTSGRVTIVLAALIVGLAATGGGAYALSRSRGFQLAGVLVSNVEAREKLIALTFDDGPTPGYTEEVLGVLKAHGARATFYLTGKECVQYVQGARAIAAGGHEIGNHTYSHSRLMLMPDENIAEEIERTDAAIMGAGYVGPITVRPPGCKRLLAAPLYLARTDRTTVTWDLEPDSIPGVAESADAIVANVVEGAHPGAIVDLHVMYPGRAPTRAALPRIIERLRAKGYRFVTVSELISAR
jgi:peptidoglycan/xylan/chitin deacetylase (PgdA/CDA1 family)